MMRKSHLRLIAGHSVRHGIRGGAGLVSLLLTLVLGLVLASVVISPLEEAERVAHDVGASGAERAEITQKIHKEVVTVTRKAIDWAVDPSSEQLDFLTSDKPAVVSAILVLIFLVTPLLACLGSFNQTSGDIATRGLRFLLIRTERTNIYLGRFIGTFLFNAFVFAALFLILAVYMAVKVKVHDPGPVMMWLAQGYLRLLVLSLPYVAVCAWISASIDSPFGALVISLLIAYVFPLLVGMATNVHHGARFLQYATPWGFKYWMLTPVGPHLLGGIAVMLGFTALFLVIGLKQFTSRDL